MYFPLFLMKSGRKRSAHSRRQFIQCFLTGAAFRQHPLSPLTSQGSCRDKKIAPGGISTETLIEGKDEKSFLSFRDDVGIVPYRRFGEFSFVFGQCLLFSAAFSSHSALP